MLWSEFSYKKLKDNPLLPPFNTYNMELSEITMVSKHRLKSLLPERITVKNKNLEKSIIKITIHMQS